MVSIHRNTHAHTTFSYTIMVSSAHSRIGVLLYWHERCLFKEEEEKKKENRVRKEVREGLKDRTKESQVNMNFRKFESFQLRYVFI